MVGDYHPKGEATTILAYLTANSMHYKKNRYWSDLLSLCIHPFAHFFSGTTRPKKLFNLKNIDTSSDQTTFLSAQNTSNFGE